MTGACRPTPDPNIEQLMAAFIARLRHPATRMDACRELVRATDNAAVTTLKRDLAAWDKGEPLVAGEDAT